MSVDNLRAAVGSEVAVSPWLELPQSRVDEFAGATLDAQWIHVDAQRAALASPLRDAAGRGRTVAHGFLTLSLLSYFLDSAIEIRGLHVGVNAGFDRVRFIAPVPVGTRLRTRFVLAELRDIDGGAALAWDATIECDDNGRVTTVVVARWLTRALLD
jgi:acyl dehydratase